MSTLGENVSATIQALDNIRDAIIAKGVSLPSNTPTSEYGAAVEAILPPVGAPRDIIVMWSGSVENIPFGWRLCDGTKDTPDLRDRFVVGAGGRYEWDTTGGSADETITPLQLPGHSHLVSGTTNTGGNHYHTLFLNSGSTVGKPYIYKRGSTTGAGSTRATVTSSSAGAHGHGIPVTAMSQTGQSQPHNNLPPYYSMCFIMKVREQ